MTAEIFKLAMPKRLFVFVAAQNAERLDAFETSMRSIGGVCIGPQAYSVGTDRSSPEGIRDALGALLEGECVYVIGAEGEALESYIVAAPKKEGGIAVG